MEQSAQSQGSTDRMPDTAMLARLRAAIAQTTASLLEERTAAGHWEGCLSSSPLSTATAITALAVFNRCGGSGNFAAAIASGLKWLEENVNEDGGWGDTGSGPRAGHSGGIRPETTLSNISTTALCWAAFGAVTGADKQYGELMAQAEKWLQRKIHEVNPAISIAHDLKSDPAPLIAAIIARYGKDRTFSAPILTACALAGRLGPGKEAWKSVLALPFELAAFPPATFATLRLPVVSYALPALIAIGHARHFHAPSRNPFARLARILTRRRALNILERIQPGSGGFLEATPLTSFVVMSLAGSGEAVNPVAVRGIEFLLRSQRADGSWPIDTNLSTWVTTLSIDALAATKGETRLSGPGFKQTFAWLLQQQYRAVHPYTHAAPGGWAWTDLSGGVPDADDTAGALVALAHGLRSNCGIDVAQAKAAVIAGSNWLLGLQNRDGGIPTFCRGWGNLPFDRSSCDITAHAVRAWISSLAILPQSTHGRVIDGIRKAIHFLADRQSTDGAWTPLWFGNQFVPSEENFTYGTARVLTALASVRDELLTRSMLPDWMRARGVAWLIGSQNADGGWGGAAGVVSTVEETALAIEALVINQDSNVPGLTDAIRRATSWILAATDSGAWMRPAPIGFYFAKLWYYERLYPRIFTVGALNRAMEWWEEATTAKTSN